MRLARYARWRIMTITDVLETKRNDILRLASLHGTRKVRNPMSISSCNHTCIPNIDTAQPSNARFYRFPHQRQRECHIDHSEGRDGLPNMPN